MITLTVVEATALLKVLERHPGRGAADLDVLEHMLRGKLIDADHTHRQKSMADEIIEAFGVFIGR